MKMAKYFVQIVILGSQVVGRALIRTVEQEIAASREAAKRINGSPSGTGSGKIGTNNTTTTGLSLEEAMQILNLQNLELEHVKKNYEHLFHKNDKGKDGSFYLLSKIVRAKERIDAEIKTIKPGQSIKKYIS